jgi:hypothetical protein
MAKRTFVLVSIVVKRDHCFTVEALEDFLVIGTHVVELQKFLRLILRIVDVKIVRRDSERVNVVPGDRPDGVAVLIKVFNTAVACHETDYITIGRFLGILQKFEYNTREK